LARQTTNAKSVTASCQAVLSLHANTQALQNLMRQPPLSASSAQRPSWVLLNGPEGGLSDAEDALARAQGFVPVTLGARVLRAETAALAGLAMLTLA
jgi:16S rRNA (uracil1498-N3)-methyltransferase